ncbi:hypothetical protein [Actinomadura rugatobispora]|uniref:Uncharacterized protein n=1 Tax=Actinomadura rugatobispora TaxID=1994 RepID=A0ABW0ZVK5_9ACTN|nr:hypothetical protein GCM10010200_036470 [Actinomadura rugatobispora]
MAVGFVRCRRKDDHSVVTDIAETALPHWPDWEPIPAKEPALPAEPASTSAETPADQGSPSSTTTESARKSRSRAADPKE